MRIRMEPELRDAFVQACKQQDTCAAQVLRAFMRDYLERVGYGRQQTLGLGRTTIADARRRVRGHGVP